MAIRCGYTRSQAWSILQSRLPTRPCVFLTVEEAFEGRVALSSGQDGWRNNFI
jgi:hypothetical protein